MNTVEDVLEKYRYHPQFLGMELNSVNQKGAMGDTPLHIACNRDNLDDVRWLVDFGANVNACGDLGLTPLHVAIARGSIDIARLLLKVGARTDIKDDNGESAWEMVQFFPEKHPLRGLFRNVDRTTAF